ncbi:helix-turn-helix domain-containing protein [Nonomuraea zeae]|uniref:Helix-turn-helix transcriptional regulator n=1 Tax=Nonomuraea zeae TaxID=1642303 RepID=A0A5S4G3X2_9ACTN|nr:helix-turn-helix transcriptional regulator [Nonomuraea zeae]TMR27666.1 helix-turn-helix transcriptional regulator [Nonomuraea zeae]
MSKVPAWASRLRIERTRRGWSQRDLAGQLSKIAGRLLPEPENLVRRIRDHESGKHRPDDEYAEMYCRLYGLSESALFRAACCAAVKAPRNKSRPSQLDHSAIHCS